MLEVVRAWSPHGADRFYTLARSGYYDDSRFSRVVPDFIAQFGVAGDSAKNATWSTRAFPDDSVRSSNVRGAVAFAMTGPNTRTTQVYISLVDNRRLDSTGFSPIGRVVEGMSVVDRLYGGYGENSGGGVRAGRQGPLMAGGNAYADREYPLLDRLQRIVDHRSKVTPRDHRRPRVPPGSAGVGAARRHGAIGEAQRAIAQLDAGLSRRDERLGDPRALPSRNVLPSRKRSRATARVETPVTSATEVELRSGSHGCRML